MNRLGQMAAAASRRSQQQDAGPRGGRHLGLGAGPPHGRRHADDPLHAVTQGRLLPESLQLLVQFLRFVAVVRCGSGVFSARSCGSTMATMHTISSSGRRRGTKRARRNSALACGREPGHVGRDFTAFQNGRRRTKPGGRPIEAGQLVAGMIDALPPQQFLRVGPQPVAAGLVQVEDRQGVIEHIERLRGRSSSLTSSAAWKRCRAMGWNDD